MIFGVKFHLALPFDNHNKISWIPFFFSLRHFFPPCLILCRPVIRDVAWFTTANALSGNLPLVWQWVWHPSVLSHALLSIHRLQRCEATILPLSSTCFLGTVELTVSSALCLSLHPPRPPLSPLLCLWGCLAAFPSFCSHAPFAFVCRTAIGWCTFLVLFLAVSYLCLKER